MRTKLTFENRSLNTNVRTIGLFWLPPQSTAEHLITLWGRIENCPFLWWHPILIDWAEIPPGHRLGLVADPGVGEGVSVCLASLGASDAFDITGFRQFRVALKGGAPGPKSTALHFIGCHALR